MLHVAGTRTQETAHTQAHGSGDTRIARCIQPHDQEVKATAHTYLVNPRGERSTGNPITRE